MRKPDIHLILILALLFAITPTYHAQAYDLWHTEKQMKDELSKIEPVITV